jgi:hypothetical protein
MRLILNPNKLIIGFALLAFAGCTKQQESYTQTITSITGLSNSEITYKQGDKTIMTNSLVAGDYQYKRIENGDVQVTVTDAGGTTTFNDVPSKYINLDATIEVTRNIFQDYFPPEWEAMKGEQFTSIYIKSKQDNQVFYMKCVFTNSDREIGKYSEDF